MLKQLGRSGVLEELGDEGVFLSAHDAVSVLQTRQSLQHQQKEQEQQQKEAPVSTAVEDSKGDSELAAFLMQQEARENRGRE